VRPWLDDDLSDDRPCRRLGEYATHNPGDIVDLVEGLEVREPMGVGKALQVGGWGHAGPVGEAR
jgi:hypothetical protein